MDFSVSGDLHWRYLQALNDDFSRIARYIEPTENNLNTYSIENARILMMAAQECDVLLKMFCKEFSSDDAQNEQVYRKILMQNCPKIAAISVTLPVYSIVVVPFEDWLDDKTPRWWTANNKVKHNRDTHFERASLWNVISSISGVLVALLYVFRDENGNTDMKLNLEHFSPLLKDAGATMAVASRRFKIEN